MAYANKYVQVCATCTSGTITGLTNGVSYQFIAFATNGVGNGAYTWSNVVTPGGSSDLLVPTAVVATRGDRQATVTWTNPGIRLSGLTTYVVKVFGENNPTTSGGVDDRDRSDQHGGGHRLDERPELLRHSHRVDAPGDQRRVSTLGGVRTGRTAARPDGRQRGAE